MKFKTSIPCLARTPDSQRAKASGSERISDNLLTITSRGENKLRTLVIEDKFSVAVDCATLQNTIDYSLQLQE